MSCRSGILLRAIQRFPRCNVYNFVDHVSTIRGILHSVLGFFHMSLVPLENLKGSKLHHVQIIRSTNPVRLKVQPSGKTPQLSVSGVDRDSWALLRTVAILPLSRCINMMSHNICFRHKVGGKELLFRFLCQLAPQPLVNVMISSRTEQTWSPIPLKPQNRLVESR